MTITINDPELEQKLATIGKKQIVQVAKTRMAIAILEACTSDMRNPNHWQKLLKQPSSQTASATEQSVSDIPVPTNQHTGVSAPVGHSASAQPACDGCNPDAGGEPTSPVGLDTQSGAGLKGSPASANPPEEVSGACPNDQTTAGLSTQSDDALASSAINLPEEVGGIQVAAGLNKQSGIRTSGMSASIDRLAHGGGETHPRSKSTAANTSPRPRKCPQKSPGKSPRKIAAHLKSA